jgi:hypothetical protein
MCPRSPRPLLSKGAAPARRSKRFAPALPYELGSPAQSLNYDLYPINLRGEAYVAAHKGSAAAVESRKIHDRPGFVTNGPIGALAQLGLARAYAVSDESTKGPRLPHALEGRRPNIPILTAAKGEQAKLH